MKKLTFVVSIICALALVGAAPVQAKEKTQKTAEVKLKVAKKGSEKAFLKAAEKGDLEAVQKYLARENANVNVTRKDGATALVLASCEGHLNVALELLAQDDIDVTAKQCVDKVCDYRQSALRCAVSNSLPEVVHEILKHEEVDVNDNGWEGPSDYANDGYTPFVMAVVSNDVPVLKELLTRKDVKLNVKAGRYDRTALMYAAQDGHVEAIEALYQWDISDRPDDDRFLDVNQQDRYGWTALMLAAEYNQIGSVATLLQWEKLDPKIKNTGGKTAMDETDNKIIKRMIKKNIDKYNKRKGELAARMIEASYNNSLL